MICHVDGVYGTPTSSCKSFNQLQDILRSAQQAEDNCPDIRKKTLLSFAINAVLLLAKKSEEEAVMHALRKDNRSRRNAGIKWGVTYHIQAARSKVQING